MYEKTEMSKVSPVDEPDDIGVLSGFNDKGRLLMYCGSLLFFEYNSALAYLGTR